MFFVCERDGGSIDWTRQALPRASNWETMAHAKSLRIIGQSLEVARLRTFDLSTEGPDYIVKSVSLTQTVEWILRHALRPHEFSYGINRQSTGSRSVRFAPADISRLDDQARRHRRGDASPPDYGRLSQLLRALGDQLDQAAVGAFQLSWTPDSASVNTPSTDDQSDSKKFTAEKLQQHGSRARLRRSRGLRYGVPIPKKPSSFDP